MAWMMSSNEKMQTVTSLENIWKYNIIHKYEIAEYEEQFYSENSSDSETKDIIIDDGIKRISYAVCISALNAWIFLISSSKNYSAIGSLLEEYEKPLVFLLKSDNFQLRIAAGKVLTVLIHNYNIAVENDPEFETQV